MKEEHQRLVVNELHEAAAKGDVRTLRRLCSAGVDFNDSLQSTIAPLHRAAQSGRIDAVRYLLRNKADVNIQDGNGYTPLHWVSSPYSSKRQDAVDDMLRRRKDIAQLLVRYGADRTLKDRSHRTAEELAMTNPRRDLYTLVMDTSELVFFIRNTKEDDMEAEDAPLLGEQVEDCLDRSCPCCIGCHIL